MTLTPKLKRVSRAFDAAGIEFLLGAGGPQGYSLPDGLRTFLGAGANPITAATLLALATNLNTTSNAFTRATSAYDPNTDTIVGAGVRRQRNQVVGGSTYAMDLIEGARTNILAAGTSTRFDRWTAVNSLAVTADTTAAPNGEVIAQTLTDPGGTLSAATQAVTVLNDSLLHVFSIYVLKTSGGTAPTFGIDLALTGGTGVTTSARINTDTGAQQYGSNVNTSVVSANTLWWRVIVIVTNNTSGNVTLTTSLYPAASAYGASVDAAAATGSAVLAFADLNKSLASSTSTFAASYNSNRNVLLQSETLDNASWTKTRSTVTANTTANPLDGAVNADTINEDNTGTNTHSVSQVFTKAASAIQFTFSTYIKQSGRTWAFIECTDTGITNGAGIYFDVANGVKGTAVALGVGWTLDASTITAVGSFYRCTITVTTNTATTIRANVFSATADLGVVIVTPLNAAALICWGNMLTYGATVQTYWATTTLGLRAADVLTSTLTVSTVAGTLLAVCRPYGWNTAQDGVSTPRPWSSTTTPTDCLFSMNATVATASFRRDDAGGLEQVGSVVLPTPTNGVTFSAGMTWDASAVTAYPAGRVGGTPDTTLTPPYAAVSSISVGSSGAAGAQAFYGYVLDFYWDAKALSPAEMRIVAASVAA